MKDEKLYLARKRLGMSQNELAKKLGVSKTTVSNWETGYSTPPLERALIVSRILNKDVSDLFERYAYLFDEKRNNNE